MKINVGGLQDTLSGLLEEYGDSVREGMAGAVIKAGKKTLKMVRDRSPKVSGTYRRGWRMTRETGSVNSARCAVVIHNSSKYQLTHLLEHGHQKASGGRVEGVPHIRPADEAGQVLFIQLVREAIEEAGK